MNVMRALMTTVTANELGVVGGEDEDRDEDEDQDEEKESDVDYWDYKPFTQAK